MPNGTSIKPLLLIFPTSEKVFVPKFPSTPNCRYHLGPFRNICGIVPRVSTLLIIVGFPFKPETAGNGGRVLGIPRLPSIEWISAVSSPQTKAPAPSFIFISSENSEPKIFWPKNPYSFIWRRACSSRRMARGYSARI